MLHPRARTMLLLAVPALIIGVASSPVLIVVMKVAAVLQTILWTALPVKLGISIDSPGWIMMMLTLTGIAVGLVIRYSPGHAGPDPALEPLIGAPVSPSALPGLIIALIIGLAGGVSLGPEHPIMAVNIALAVFLGRVFSRALARWTGRSRRQQAPSGRCLALRSRLRSFFRKPSAVIMKYRCGINSSRR